MQCKEIPKLLFPSSTIDQFGLVWDQHAHEQPVTPASTAACIITYSTATVARNSTPLTPSCGHTVSRFKRLKRLTDSRRLGLVGHVGQHLLACLNPSHLLALSRSSSGRVSETPCVEGVIFGDTATNTDTILHLQKGYSLKQNSNFNQSLNNYDANKSVKLNTFTFTNIQFIHLICSVVDKAQWVKHVQKSLIFSFQKVQ